MTIETRTSKPLAGPFSLPKIFARAFSPDGRRMVCANREGKVRVFDAASGEPLSPVIHLSSECARAEFAAGGTALITLNDGKVQLWDSHTGAPLGPAIPAPGYSLSDDQKLIVRTTGYTVRFFDLKPLDWPADDVLKTAELLSSHRIDNYGSLVPLSGEEVSKAWHDLWPRYLKPQAQEHSP